jgi:WD40-like Beta Propeller Repeat
MLGVVVAAIGVGAPPAWGAFPGRDGELAVATGNGLELVEPATGIASLICSDVLLCGRPAQPAFSPNGQAIVFVDRTSGRPVVVAADGSCLWCLLGAPLTGRIGSEPAFMPGGQGVTVVRNGLWAVSLVGRGARRLLKGPVDGAVWSSRGFVALVRGGWIWVGRPGRGALRRLARGRSPSFSPDGARLALARNGYVWTVRVADGTQRRLVRGGAPAWSPDGRQIAYIAAGGTVEIVAARGGPPHKVGSVRGAALDWQPLASSARPVCKPPRGSTVVASNREAVVFSPRPLVFSGCLKALGRTQLLLDWTNCYCGPVMAVRLAGRFAAIQSGSGKAPSVAENDTLFDLSSGNATPLAGVSWDSSNGHIVYGLDSLSLDLSGFAAWRETTRPVPAGIGAISCPSASLCVADDRAGNILSSTNPTGGESAWNSTGVLSSPASGGFSCPSISLCAAVGVSSVLTATDPSGGASAWMTAPIGGYPDLGAISCPSVSLCVAGGGGPNILTILTSTDPTGGASAWTTASIPYGGRLSGVSCPSVSLCVATTNSEDVFTSTNPTGGASTWTKTTVDPGGSLNAVSCPSVSLCVAVDTAGNALASTNPGGGASTWTTANIDPGHAVWAVSCPSVSLCVAVDLAGNVLTSTDPTGGASAWARTPIDRAYLTAVSCPSVSLCVTGDELGNIMTSTDPTGGANTWTSAAVDIPGCSPQSTPCISEQLYAHDDQGTRVVDTAPPGSGNSIGNVILDGESLMLSWTHDGTQRQLALR